MYAELPSPIPVTAQYPFLAMPVPTCAGIIILHLY